MAKMRAPQPAERLVSRQEVAVAMHGERVRLAKGARSMALLSFAVLLAQVALFVATLVLIHGSQR